MTDSKTLERDAALQAARLTAAVARTAPKTERTTGL